MKVFKETKDLARYQGGVEIELHQRYGDLEPYDINETETYFTGHKIYICRCLNCGRVINASRENLLYGNWIHCGCASKKYEIGYGELDTLDNFDYLQLDICNCGSSSKHQMPFKPVTKKEIEDWKKESKKIENDPNYVDVEMDDGSWAYKHIDEIKNNPAYIQVEDSDGSTMYKYVG